MLSQWTLKNKKFSLGLGCTTFVIIRVLQTLIKFCGLLRWIIFIPERFDSVCVFGWVFSNSVIVSLEDKTICNCQLQKYGFSKPNAIVNYKSMDFQSQVPLGFKNGRIIDQN